MRLVLDAGSRLPVVVIAAATGCEARSGTYLRGTDHDRSERGTTL